MIPRIGPSAILSLTFSLAALIPAASQAQVPPPDRAHMLAPFDVPFAGASQTSPWGINDAGVVVGNYLASDGNGHGFLYRNGQFIDVSVTGAVFSELIGISNRGDAVGDFEDAAGVG